ncbi:MAG: hypothetical protein AMXMBFR80_25510 [Dehalococcoidia bacterium]
MAPGEIAADPGLTVAQVHAALAFSHLDREVSDAWPGEQAEIDETEAR